MSQEYSEDNLIENATEESLKELGWEVKTAWYNEDFGPNSLLGRESKNEVILTRYLRQALEKLNPNLPNQAYEQAIDFINQKSSNKSLAQINYEKYKLLKDGILVKFNNQEGQLEEKTLRVFDYEDYLNNDFLAIRQLEISGELYDRRPDVLCFVNGLPLVFIELKAHYRDLRHAYEDNLKDYKDVISHLFYTNAFIILSNGIDAKIGTITSPYKFFLEWKRIEEDQEGVVSLDTMIRGTLEPKRLMDIFENFILFDTSYGEVVKLIAKNHQYLGVNKVLSQVKNINDLEGKLGVFWHTQGSGKSYSMVFLCEKIHRKLGGAYTFLIVVDRTELENQIYDTFSGVGVVNDKNLIAGKKKGLSGREHLRQLLLENHRYVFTLIHKFSIDPETESQYPLLTKRKNIIVISDEAHRTQGGIYARNMRFYALPNASFLGFTGTPIIKEDKELTKDLFGDYVSVYDFKRAIEDEATLPLVYSNRGEKLDIENPSLNDEMASILEDENLSDEQKQKLEYKFKQNYVVLSSKERLKKIAKDLVWHFNQRGYQGKAMLVTLDKICAVKMYDYIKYYWQEYLEELDKKIKNTSDNQEELELKRKYEKVAQTEICVIVSPEQNEVDKFKKLGLDIFSHRKKMQERNLEKEFKDPENNFRLAIVCAMWITGFDVKCVSTIYLDKPIKGHTLMQTIARANRVYDDEKENGLIVDYGNVYKQLQKAYLIYGDTNNSPKANGGEGITKNLKELEEELKQAIDEIKGFLNNLGFELEALENASNSMIKIAKLNEAQNSVCLNEKTRFTFEAMARNVFKKYKALFPEKSAKIYTKDYNAIEAIYNLLNTKVKSADVSLVIAKLQELVNDSIKVENNEEFKEISIDLSSLDFDKLKKNFLKSKEKNTMTYALQKIVEKKMKQMLKENPTRIDFYKRYEEIIKEYNKGKTLEDTLRAFENLNSFIKDLSFEDQRAIKENLDNESLAIFDLLVSDKELSNDEIKKVKTVALKVLNRLKNEKLKIEHWQQSRETKAQIKITIKDELLYLPVGKYNENDVDIKAANVYNHILSNYFNGGRSVYQMGAY